MWKVSWLYEKVHNFLVVPLYYLLKPARSSLSGTESQNY